MDDRLKDYSKAHETVRRKMRRLLLGLKVENAAEIVESYYTTITLAEHEAARRALT